MPELHTFSIVARCAATGMLGVGVASAIPCVGSISPFVRSGVGATSTQAWCNPYVGLAALRTMEAGMPAAAALEYVLRADAQRDFRQIGLIDRHGEAVAWTGPRCTPWAGQLIGTDHAVIGNMLAGPQVLEAMQAAYIVHRGQDLATALVAALQAGEQAGGDRRGKQSAAVKVLAAEDYPFFDLRVDDHPTPTAELARIHDIARHQLLPFIADMPTRDDWSRMPGSATAQLLALSPPDRPGAGGAFPAAAADPRASP